MIASVVALMDGLDWIGRDASRRLRAAVRSYTACLASVAAAAASYWMRRA